MSAFNLVDGIPATANKWLLTNLLRNEWGFGGMVVTDYYSIGEMKTYGVADKKEASVLALKAGTDMDMVTAGFWILWSRHWRKDSFLKLILTVPVVGCLRLSIEWDFLMTPTNTATRYVRRRKSLRPSTARKRVRWHVNLRVDEERGKSAASFYG